MRHLAGAIRFLTILPIGEDATLQGGSAVFFPMVGALLGWLGAQWMKMIEPWCGNAVAALLVLGLWALLTGACAEQSFAKIANAFRDARAGRNAVVQSSSGIGTLGWVALCVLLLMRWQALTRMPVFPITEFVACLSVSRAMIVVQAWISRPIDSAGEGFQFANTLTSTSAVAAIALGLVASLLPGWQNTTLLLCGTAISATLLHRWFDVRFGGMNLDCMRASSLAIESFGLVLLSCQNCFL